MRLLYTLTSNKKRIRIFYIFAILIFVICFLCWGNNAIVISNYEYTSSKIPGGFNNYKLAQISDLHNKEFGENQKNLLKKLEKTLPDIILVTGDLVDSNRYDLDKAMDFIKGAVNIAPVYYVSGNHEAWIDEYPEIKEKLINSGVIVLEDSISVISKGKESINILGLQDPSFTGSNKMKESVELWSENKDFQILLSHRPDYFDFYAQNSIDLVFSGHVHGGQFRLPFIGGLLSPERGFFPKYSSGCYRKKSSAMFVSRGLGNSVIPIRLFNRPEILTVTLKSI